MRYGSISVSELRNFANVSIDITYHTANGQKHTAVCYVWDFNEDLNARDEEGNILNSFLVDPLAGNYTLENGYLTGDALMLQLEQRIELESDQNCR